ncbi:hypothetical protein Tco_1142119 [Tanacetum coccineum]
MKEGSSLKEHLDALNSILMDLKNVEVKIEDEDAALVLLVSLPPSFESFVSSFVVGKDTITLEDVISSLHSRELRPQASGSGGYESQSMGLLTTSRDRGRYRFEKGKIMVEHRHVIEVLILEIFVTIAKRQYGNSLREASTPFAVWSSTKLGQRSDLVKSKPTFSLSTKAFLPRERRRQMRNEDLRTELEYYSEEYDEEREMEPRLHALEKLPLSSEQDPRILEDK